MMKPALLSLAILGILQAQQVVAPTPEPVGSPRGETLGNYNLMQSYEFGVRFRQVGGDEGEYRSDANYGNGLRLLGSSLSLESQDGHGRFFDELLLNTTGLGNDPYESAMLRLQKNGLYRYDMSWRLSDYFNPGLTAAGGAHLADTSRRIQDHDFTLFPQSPYQLHLGYTRNTENGPALSTAQEFDATGTGYPVFTNVRRQWNEYRIGADAELAGFKFTFLHRWDYFKDDTPLISDGIIAAGTPTDKTVLQQFARSQPVHGSAPGWFGNLHGRRKWWGMNARLSYVEGRNNFALAESAQGIGAAGSTANRQIAVGGDASRPALAGDFSLTFYPSDRLTVVNNTSVSNNRIDGLSSYSEVLNNLPQGLGTTVYFRYLAVRLIANSTSVDYRATDWLALYGGWHYADRQVRTIEGLSLPAFANSAENDYYQVSNQMQSGDFGVRLNPWKPFTVNLQGEIGRTNHPLTTVSDKNFQTLGGRAQYRVKKLQLSAAYRESYDFNSAFSLFSSHQRGYTASAVWTPKDWFALDASYNKLHSDSSSFLAFFANTSGGSRNSLQARYRDEYLSNIHCANLGVRFGFRRRADLYLGYSITKDAGDGRPSAIPAGTTDPVASLLNSVQTFPLTYQSPLARVSVRITPKVRWNAGYQFYNYAEQFGLLSYYQNFHAHTGFTSVLWTF